MRGKLYIMPYNTSLVISLILDIFAVFGMLYMFIVLKIKDESLKKSKLTLSFERYKRVKIIRNSIFILLISFILSFIALYGTLFNFLSFKFSTFVQLLSKIYLIIFIFYIIKMIRYTTRIS